MLWHKQDSIKAAKEKEDELVQLYMYIIDLEYRLLFLEWGVTE